jgi:hypothetical protein
MQRIKTKPGYRFIAEMLVMGSAFATIAAVLGVIAPLAS